jgi:hypothetical protein
MTPGCFDWPAQYAGDTSDFEQISLTRSSGPISLVGATIQMQVRKRRGQTPLLDLTSVASAGIEITDAANGVFRVGGYANPDIEALLIYDLQVTFSDGTIKTYLEGAYPIYGQVTK